MSEMGNIKKQGFFAIFFVMMVAFGLSVIASYTVQKQRLEDINKVYFEKVKSSYDKHIEQGLKVYYSNKMKHFLSDEAIIAVYQKNRIRLAKIIQNDFKQLQSTYRDVKQLHFHLADGTTLYRAHKPEFYGDNIARERPMVQAAHTTKSMLFGFEGGKNGLSYRIFTPIFYQEQYVGTLEIGISPQKLLELVTYFNDIDAIMQLDGSALQPNSKNMVFSKLSDTNLIKGFSLGFERACELSYKNNKFVANKLIMNDFSGKKIGEFIFFNNITKEYNYLEQELFYHIFIFGFVFVALLFVVHFIFTRLMRNLTDVKNELETILQTSRDGIAILDLETRFLFFNDSYLKMTGFTNDELLAKSCAELSAPEDLQRSIEVVQKVKEFGFVDNFEQTCIVKDGKRVVVNMAVALMPDKKRLLITTKDITQSKALQRQLDGYIKLIDENIITSSTDTKGVITSVSKAFCDISEFSKEDLIGTNHRIIRHPDMPKSLFEEMWSKILHDEVWDGEVKNKTKSGGFYWVQMKIYPIYDELEHKIGYTAIRHDITDKKKIEEISITDGLTGIFNRRHFNEIFPKFIQSAKRNDDIVCFLLMDIDHFKQYNDNYGHQAGDSVLIAVAQAIQNSTHRVDDYCFRLGGEEFGVLFKTNTIEYAYSYANTIRANIENLHIVHEYSSASSYITISLGLVVLHATDIIKCEFVYKQADDLLYLAKQSGRNRVFWNEGCTILTPQA